MYTSMGWISEKLGRSTSPTPSHSSDLRWFSEVSAQRYFVPSSRPPPQSWARPSARLKRGSGGLLSALGSARRRGMLRKMSSDLPQNSEQRGSGTSMSRRLQRLRGKMSPSLQACPQQRRLRMSRRGFLRRRVARRGNGASSLQWVRG